MSSPPADFQENRISAVDLFSMTLAVAEGSKTCPIHERCDGSCSGPQIVFQPLVYGTPHSRVLAARRPYQAESGVARAAPLTIDDSIGPFHYDSLVSEDRAIRLMRVKSAVFRDDPVECDLLEFSLDTLPNYAALSYCGGVGPLDTKIVCNGKLFSIRSTLRDALRRYRQAHGSNTLDKPELLWADAVCINQEDIPERNAQLLLMQAIYRRAEAVYIDLGDVDPTWYVGYDLLNKVYIVKGMVENDRRDVTAADLSTVYGLPGADHISWRAYFYIFSAPWFLRTWSIQEIVLARKCIVLFGRFNFTFSMLVETFRFLTRFGYHLRPCAMFPGTVNFIYLLMIQEDYRNGTCDCLRLMRLTCDFFVSDLKDKVFAVLALMGENRGGLRQDYSLPIARIYQRFAAHLVHCGKGVDMLAYAGLQRRNPFVGNLPSWVPDWAAQSRDIASKAISTIRNQPYRASGSSVSAIRLLGDRFGEEGISVEGSVIDTICHLSEGYKMGSPDKQAEYFLEWYRSARALFEEKTTENCLVYEQPEDAFCRTLLMDDLYTDQNATAGTTAIRNLIPSHYVALLNLSIRGVQQGDGRKDEVATYEMQIISACFGHRFAVTAKGYIALVPNCSLEGDRVCIFLGSSVPYVLRPKSKERFLLVGDAYVHGITDGEALEFDDFIPQEIPLC